MWEEIKTGKKQFINKNLWPRLDFEESEDRFRKYRTERLRNGIVLSGRMTLAAVFLFGGIGKLIAPRTATLFVSSILFAPNSVSLTLVIALSLTELLIGMSLIVRFKPRLFLLASATFFLVASLVSMLSIEWDESCGCFGEFLKSQTGEAFLIRSLALMFLSMVLIRFSVARKKGWLR